MIGVNNEYFERLSKGGRPEVPEKPEMKKLYYNLKQQLWLWYQELNLIKSAPQAEGKHVRKLLDDRVEVLEKSIAEYEDKIINLPR